MSTRRLGILLSGRGSNFQAISDNIRAGKLNAEIAVVLSNRESAPGLALARERRIHSEHVPSGGLSRSEYDAALAAKLSAHNVDLVCLAGYMRLLSPAFIQPFAGRILNIHPSLLPAFPGLDAQAQALAHGVKISGCTVHFVDAGLDSGPIVAQSAVPVEEGDTVETLSARILAQEHRIYTEAIAHVLSGRYRIEGRRCLLS